MKKQARPGKPPKNRRPNLGKCPTTGKTRFRDKREADRAVQKATTARKNAAEMGVTSRRHECRTYFCDACKGWHITSQETRLRKLAPPLDSGWLRLPLGRFCLVIAAGVETCRWGV